MTWATRSLETETRAETPVVRLARPQPGPLDIAALHAAIVKRYGVVLAELAKL